MYRLMHHFFSTNSFISFLLFICVVILIIIKNKINIKLWRILCIFPFVFSIAHFFAFYMHEAVDYTISRFISMYIYSLLIIIWQFFYKKNKLFKISSIIICILGLSSFMLVFYGTIMDENVHNLTYDNYTTSFNKTIKILKKEYVLNEYKNIDYDYLYNKYYPLIEKAEKDNDEQLYFKTMYEFSKNFKDGHFKFMIYFTNFEETAKRYDFINDYYNKEYGFASILLSNGNIVAISVDNNGEAYNKGLRDGMVITKKNGVDIHSILDEIITPNESFPVLEDDQLLNSLYLFGTGGDEISVSYLNDNNEEVTINVHSTGEQPSKADIIYNKLMYYNYDLDNLDTRMLDGNTGYIYISHEMYSPFKGALGYLSDDSSYLTKVVDDKLAELKKQGMKNLIIDLRANSGGYMTESEAIASLFTKDSYLLSMDAKYNSSLYDKSYLRGNGKYSDMKLTILVNSDTASAGDCLAYMFSKMPNAKIVGFTNSNNSAQSVGGIIFLSGGTSYIAYPIYKSLDSEGKILIDTDSTRKATIKLNQRVELTKETLYDIINTDDDYLLNYALKLMD